MSLALTKERGIPLEKQQFTRKDFVRHRYSKLGSGAFTGVRVILTDGIELELLRFQHGCARMNQELQLGPFVGSPAVTARFSRNSSASARILLGPQGSRTRGKP